MSTERAQSKREKCKYKRCIAKRFYPEIKPRYCIKHKDQLEYKEVVANIPDEEHPWNVSPEESQQSKTKFITRIKKWIFVQE